MQLTLLTHRTFVTVTEIIGITLVVLPFIFYIFMKLCKSKLGKRAKRLLVSVALVGLVVLIPFYYYLYLDKKYDISEYTNEDVLYVAISSEDEKAIDRMIGKKLDPSKPTRFGDGCFYKAVQLGDMELAKRLLDNGADVNATVTSFTPLGVACRAHNYDMAKWLLENGADPDYRYGECVSALNCAASSDKGYDVKLIELLCSYDADRDSVCISANGRRMLPFKYYFRKAWKEELSPEDAKAYERIAELLEQSYRDWVMENADFIIRENDGDENEAVS